MILDTLKNCTRYEMVHPRFKVAFDFLNSTDLLSLPTGKTELDGADVVVNVVEITGKPIELARMETHNQYIDIQIPLGTTETMGWKSADQLEKPTGPYNAEKDITFFEDSASNLIKVQPFEFAIFFPEDGHQPGIGEATYKKIIVKLRV
jgi:biofilm protein TabA